MPKVKADTVRKDFRLPTELTAWAKKYAEENHMTLTALIVQQLTALRVREESGYAEQI